MRNLIQIQTDLAWLGYVSVSKWREVWARHRF